MFKHFYDLMKHFYDLMDHNDLISAIETGFKLIREKE